jgi:hypothetical protein
MTTFASDWLQKRDAFVVNTSSALSIYQSNLGAKKSLYLISEIAYIVAMLTADGILVSLDTLCDYLGLTCGIDMALYASLEWPQIGVLRSRYYLSCDSWYVDIGSYLKTS